MPTPKVWVPVAWCCGATIATRVNQPITCRARMKAAIPPALVHSRRVIEVRTRCQAVRWAGAGAGRRGVDSGAAVIGGRVFLSDGRLR